MSTSKKVVTTGVLVALAVLAAVIVYQISPSENPSILDKNTLVIGVKSDQPGLGLEKNGKFEGFDVDVATYVAGRLGVDRKNLTFRRTLSNERETALRNGLVDMVFATYSITPERKNRVTFGGPYYVAHQDILVRERDNSIKNVRDLRGKRLCGAEGSYSTRRVTEERKVAATLVPAPSYSACVTALVQNRVDAVSTDDLILAGFAVANNSGAKLVNAPFTDEKYGVGLRKGDVKGCEKVNRILTEMYQTGAAKTLLSEWFGSGGLDITTTVPQFEGCS